MAARTVVFVAPIAGDDARLRLRRALTLPIRVALLLVLLGVLGVLFWPAWSANARRQRLGIMTALAGDDGP
jgi:hypothetical protein